MHAPLMVLHIISPLACCVCGSAAPWARTAASNMVYRSVLTSATRHDSSPRLRPNFFRQKSRKPTYDCSLFTSLTILPPSSSRYYDDGANERATHCQSEPKTLPLRSVFTINFKLVVLRVSRYCCAQETLQSWIAAHHIARDAGWNGYALRTPFINIEQSDT